MTSADLEMTDAELGERGRMTDELELLQASIVERLRRAGVSLSAEELRPIVEALAADAVRISLDWLERR